MTEQRLNEILKVLTDKSETKPSRVDRDTVNELAVYLEENEEILSELTLKIFGHQIPTDASFYEQLYKLTNVVGHLHFGASEVLGKVWVSAFSKVGVSDRENLLALLPSASHSFFTLLDALPVVLGRCRIDPTFAIDLFFKLKERVGNDMANGGLWRGFDAWTAAFPEDAFDGLLILLYRGTLGEAETSVGAALLGGLRVSLEKASSFVEKQEEIERLKDDPDLGRRVVYHRSWINTCRLRGLKHTEFADCLGRMSSGSQVELWEGFNFLRCLAGDSRLETDSLKLASKWLDSHVAPSISDESKYGVVVAIRSFVERKVSDLESVSILRSLLVRSLPIPLEHKGTWMEIESLLSSLLEDEDLDFEGWLIDVLKTDPEGLMPQLKYGGAFEGLLRSIPRHRIQNIVTGALVSPIRSCREFAFTLIDELGIETLDSKELSKACDDLIAVSIFESRLHHLKAESMFRFLSTLSVRVKNGSPKLLAFFRTELLFQAKNFPGAVLEGLKKLPDKCELITGVIVEADQYFDALKSTHRSAINSMEIPGFRRSLTLTRRRQSKEIKSKAEEGSIFRQFFTTSYLVYGSEGFRSCVDGEIGEVSKMQEMSVSMEMPRLWMIDPEEAAIRRFEAIKAIDSLIEPILRQTKTSDEA